jgi:hypothetical protein
MATDSPVKAGTTAGKRTLSSSLSALRSQLALYFDKSAVESGDEFSMERFTAGAADRDVAFAPQTQPRSDVSLLPVGCGFGEPHDQCSGFDAAPGMSQCKRGQQAWSLSQEKALDDADGNADGTSAGQKHVQVSRGVGQAWPTSMGEQQEQATG